MKHLRKWQLFWSAFIGLGAYWGAAMMFIDPTGQKWGMEPLLPLLQKLPLADVFFQNFIWSGIVLLLVNGVTNTVAFILLAKKRHWGALAGLACGIILMLWILVEYLIFGFNFLSNIYLAFGFLQAGNGFLLWKRTKALNN